MVHHPGFCEHFAVHWHKKFGIKGVFAGVAAGLGTTTALVWGGTAGLYYGVGSLRNHFMSANIDTAAYYEHGMMYALGGMILAFGIKGVMQEKLSGSDVGMIRGGRMVKKAQAAIFALPVLAGLFLNGDNYTNKDNPSINLEENSAPLEQEQMNIARKPSYETFAILKGL